MIATMTTWTRLYYGWPLHHLSRVQKILAYNIQVLQGLQYLALIHGLQALKKHKQLVFNSGITATSKKSLTANVYDHAAIFAIILLISEDLQEKPFANIWRE